MKEVFFVQMPEIDCEAEPLNGLFYVDCSSNTPQEALNRFLSNDAVVNKTSYKTAYSAGHYGNDNHLWEMTRCELYTPRNESEPHLVLVYYKPLVLTPVFEGKQTNFGGGD